MRQADSLANYRQEYDSAIVIAQRAEDLARQLYGNADTSLSKIQNAIGRYFAYSGKYAQSESTYVSALATLRTAGFPDHPLAALIYQGLGYVYMGLGDFTSAESSYVRQLSVLQQSTGGKGPEYVSTLSNFADLYLQLESFHKADSLFDLTLKTIGDDSLTCGQEFVQSLVGIGIVRRIQGDFPASVASFDRAMTFLQSQDPPDRLRMGRALADLANSYSEFGYIAEADSLLRSAATSIEAAVGAHHVDYAKALINLGNNYVNLGDYVSARKVISQAEQIFKGNYGSYFYLLADAWTTLGAVYSTLGVLDEAARLFRSAYELRGASLGYDCYDITYDLNNLGDIELKRGNWMAAESLFIQALQIRQSDSSASKLDQTVLYENLAQVSLAQRNYDRAEARTLEALATLDPTVAADNPTRFRLLGSLASVLSAKGNRTGADSLFAIAAAHLRSLTETDHPDLATILELRSDHYRRTDRMDSALDNALESCEMRHRLFRNNAAFLSEAEALQFARSEKDGSSRCLDIYLALKNRPGRNVMTRTAASAFSVKGDVIDEMAAREKRLRKGSQSRTSATWSIYSRAKYRLAETFVRSTADNQGADYRRIADSLSRVIRDCESTLGLAVADSLGNSSVDVKQLTSLIPTGSLLLEFVRFNSMTPNSEPQYSLILCDHLGLLSINDLGPAQAIDTLLSEYRATNGEIADKKRLPSQSDSLTYARISSSLYRLLLSPVASRLRRYENLIISPDGPLNLLSFAGLIDSEGKYVVESHTIRYLSAARDLTRIQDRRVQSAGILAIGDPNFRSDPTLSSNLDTESGKVHRENTSTLSEAWNCLNLSQLQAIPLPATRREIEVIRGKWDAASKGPFQELIGDGATEARFVKSAPGKRVIHVATHGYFLPINCRLGFTAQRQVSTVDNPLLYSGLLFAGCLSKNLAHTDGHDDGILSALEVSTMDLTGVDLIVLSACETGIGDLSEGEGVYGLRRAFLTAGSKTVVSSLWQVPDMTTAAMLASLYAGDDERISVRLANAQRSILKKLRAAGLPDHPYSWAAFIAEGQD